jgi:hypothetical protein
MVSAHMEMKYPAPRRSKFLTGASPIDYDMVSPLNADGSNFPCKRYPKGPLRTTLTAGSTLRVEMSGSTFHQGGHCQFSISYNERDYVVLQTFMKNCFVGTGLFFDVPIPASTPACESCIFAWSWVNAVGNREFYMVRSFQYL